MENCWAPQCKLVCTCDGAPGFQERGQAKKTQWCNRSSRQQSGGPQRQEFSTLALFSLCTPRICTPRRAVLSCQSALHTFSPLTQRVKHLAVRSLRGVQSLDFLRNRPAAQAWGGTLGGWHKHATALWQIGSKAP